MMHTSSFSSGLASPGGGARMESHLGEETEEDEVMVEERTANERHGTEGFCFFGPLKHSQTFIVCKMPKRLIFRQVLVKTPDR